MTLLKAFRTSYLSVGDLGSNAESQQKNPEVFIGVCRIRVMRIMTVLSTVGRMLRDTPPPP